MPSASDGGRPQGRRDRSLARLLTRTLAPGLVGLAASLMVLIIVAVGLVVRVAPDLADLRDARIAARDSHDAMLDQETGLRGYLATGQQAFLEPYDSGRVDAAAAQDRLIREVSGHPELLAKVLEVSAAQRTWQIWAESAAAEVQPGRGGPSAAEMNLILGQGKGPFDDYRAVDKELLTSLDAAIDDTERTYERALIFTGAVLLVLGALAIDGLVRGRSRFQREVVTPTTELTTAVERVRAGDLRDGTAVESPVREIAALADGIDAMTTALAERAQEAADRESDLVRRGERLRQVLDLSRELSESLSLRYTSIRLRNAVSELTGAELVELWLHRNDRHELVRYDAYGRGDAPTIVLGPEEFEDGDGSEIVEVGIGAVGRAARYGRMIPLDEHRSTQVDGTTRGVAIPMVVGAQVIGVLTLTAADGAELDLDLLDALILQGSTALQAARLHGEAEERSRRDALTGLANRRQFDEDLAADVARAVRYQRPLGLMMIDLDHFKRINDTYGHARGDEVLQDVAALITRELRETDTAYRYGGEELCVLMPETGASAAAEVGERIRRRVEASFGWAVDSPVTLSAGVAELDGGVDAGALVIAADRALYAAKHGGRNRVEVGIVH